ncbi:MAG: mandelate racemase/muconate lactonizing enzyme family protein [Verrucomicrobiae bacterium]|nr:mandelate racemase/muconate lactonizing enzyme family protein [Verrucomicrobiae bacterium]
MKPLSRRNFINRSSLAAAGFPLIGLSSCSRTKPTGRLHPLDGIDRENIKITDITLTPLSYVDPKRDLWRSDDYTVWKTDAALTRVFTDQGIIGIGEGTPYAGGYRIDLLKTHTEEVLKLQLVGKNIFDVIHSRPARVEEDYIATAAWAGLDNCLWDIIGKAKSKPVYELISVDGKPQTRIRLYASGGDYHEWFDKGDETLINEALSYKEMGLDAFKFRVGTTWSYSGMNLDKYIPVMQRLRDAVGPDFKLMHESHRRSGVSVEDVINRFAPAIDELNFHWFEEPVRELEDYLKVAATMKHTRIAAGEMQRSLGEMRPWIERGAAEIVTCDCNMVGLTGNWLISRLADANGRPLCPHNWHGGLTTMVNAHLVAAIPNRHMLECNMTFNPLKTDIFKEPYAIDRGWLQLNNKPGYGLEIIDDVEKKFPYEPGSFKRPNPKMQTG